MAEIILTKEQQAVIDDRGGTLLVSAAAGSGKTKVLIDRVFKRVEEGSNIDEFLLITFTNAAAAELRGKMIVQLSERLSKKPDDRHLQRQMNRVYLAQISTVHSFCGTLLREYAHTLDLPADFRTVENSETDALQDRAMQSMLDRVYLTMRDDDEIAAALDMLGAGRDDSELPELILKVYDSVECWRDPKERLEQLRESLCVGDCEDPVQTIWGKYLFDEMKSALLEYDGAILGAIDIVQQDDFLQPYALNFMDDLEIVRRLYAAGNWSELREIPRAFSRLKTVRKCNDPEAQERLKKLRTGIKDDLAARMKNFMLPTQDVLGDIKMTASAIGGLLKLVRLFSEEYRKEKLRRHVLDYNDLEHETLRLLLDRSGKPTAVAKEIAQRFVEIMVDEYQDTNGVQDAIFGALAYRGNLFMVGDVKQSIYRFRMADPTGFLNRYKTYADYTAAEDGQPRKILLSDNFRSCPEVLSAANDLFRMLMTERVGGLKYGEAEALKPNLPVHGDRPIELHCIDTTPVPSDLHISDDELEAEFIARRITQMLEDGETIKLRDGVRPIQPEDITILMRNVKHSADTYISILKRHGIHCICANENLLDTEEIGILISLLKVIDNPYQDIPLLSVLFSSVFCFTADEMATMRANDRNGDLYDILRNSEHGREFVSTISQLRDIAAQSDLHTLLNEIDERLCLRAIYPNCDHNFDKILTLADGYEKSDRFGLSGFLRYLEAQRAKGVSSEQSAKNGAVRILTMHKSKGLEFPVVFLAGLNKQFNKSELNHNVLVDAKLGIGSKLLDLEKSVKYSTVARNAIADRMRSESRSEEMRVLYVAMTRAQCRMIMTCCGKNMARKLKNIATEMTVPPLDSYIASAASLGDWVLMCAMTRTEAGELFQQAGYSAMRYVSEHPWRITYNDAIEYLPETDTVAEKVITQEAKTTLELHTPYYSHNAASTHPSKLTATQLKGRDIDEEVAQETLHKSPLRFAKPRFEAAHTLTATERGTAIHLAMEHLRYECCADEKSLTEEINRLVRERRMTQEQADAVPLEKILRFFRCEIGKRVLSAKQFVREFKFSVLDDGGTYNEALYGEEIMLQGVADCCLIENDGLVLIDFKSDCIRAGEEAERAAYYRGQLNAYSRALSRIFEMPVKECILYFFKTDQAFSV